MELSCDVLVVEAAARRCAAALAADLGRGRVDGGWELAGWPTDQPGRATR